MRLLHDIVTTDQAGCTQHRPAEHKQTKEILDARVRDQFELWHNRYSMVKTVASRGIVHAVHMLSLDLHWSIAKRDVF